MSIDNCYDCAFVESKTAFGKPYLYCVVMNMSVKKISSCECYKEQGEDEFEINDFDDFHEYKEQTEGNKLTMGFWLMDDGINE